MSTQPAQELQESPSRTAPAAEPRQRVFLPQTWRERVACTAWAFLRPLLFAATPGFMNGWRILVLRCFGADVDRSAFIHPSARIDFPWNLSIGAGSAVEHGVIMNCVGRIEIGPHCRISQYAHLCAATHAYDDRTMPILRKPITIEADVWIAADAFVGPGVTIGEGSLLAARSSAFGDLPAGYVCIGEPAEPHRHRFAEGERQLEPQMNVGERG